MVQFRSLTYLAAHEEFAAGPIQRVVEPVARVMADDLAAAAVERRVVQHVHADFVVVPGIVRRVLEIPGQLAGVDVQRHHGVGVEVVARTRLRIVNRHRIAGAPDRELRRGVVGTGLPEAAPAGLPGVVRILPGFAARVARLRHDVPAPELLAGSRVERGDPAAGFRVARAIGDNHLAVGGDGRGIEAFDGCRIRWPLPPSGPTRSRRCCGSPQSRGRRVDWRSRGLPRARSRACGAHFPGASRRGRSPRRTRLCWARGRRSCTACPSRRWCT